ncbi:unnamed protein product [Didymodactylos carnosus]|uniref:Uncharacterized protein n=1 Tax=Didymodactylos carnosus TaxID=1234261 RepID=A0A8S2NPT0_9BILA|nr:unnamed protein product [Didymodactylos carnosus]CAF4013110.1 unnamed protein product [Didymodactylos carnosus]
MESPIIGYCFSHEKFLSLNFEQFLILCKKANIKTLEINDEYLNTVSQQQQQHQLSSPLPNIIIHKLTDMLSRELVDDDKTVHLFLEKFRNLIKNESTILMIDNLESVTKLLNRQIQYTLLNEIEHLYVPPFISITDESIAHKNIQQLLTNHNIQYPVICKPIRAHGM